MTAVPRQIDIHPQPASRRAGGREERGGGDDFALALGARADEKRATSASETTASDSDAASAGILPSSSPAVSEGRGEAPVEPGAEGIQAILDAFDGGTRRSPSAAETAVGGTTAGMSADQLRQTTSLSSQFPGLPDNMPDDARADLFRRLDASASSVFDGDAASLRLAAQGDGSSGNRIRADFVSMRTDFVPAGRGDDAGALAARTGAFGRLVADGAASAAGPDSLDGADPAEATRSNAMGDVSRAMANAGLSRRESDAARKPGSAPMAGAHDHAAENALSSPAKAGGGQPEPDGKTAANKRQNAAKTESFVASPVATEFTGPSATGAAFSVSPARQVATALGSALGEIRPEPDNSEAAGNLKLRAGGAALKTVQIQLQPAHFGKVDVTLRLIDGQLAIQLLASEPETVMRLRDDTEGLKSLLSQSGFVVDDAAISIGLRDPGQSRGVLMPGHGDNAPGGSSAEGQAPNGGASRNESGAQRGAAGQGGRDGDVQGAREAEALDAHRARADLDRSVYL